MNGVGRNILPLFSLLMGSALCGYAPWGVQSMRLTGIGTNGDNPVHPVISASGDVYVPILGPGLIAVRKMDATGRQIFDIPIAGAARLTALLLGPDGNVYVAGDADAGLMTTPGAYLKSISPGSRAPFQCSFSALDGHVLFCSYVNARIHAQGTLFGATAVDSGGNLYSAEEIGYYAYACPESDVLYGCVEKVSPTRGLMYQSSLESLKINWVTSVAADSSGNCYVTGQGDRGFVLAKFDAGGKLQGSVNGGLSEVAAVSVDPAGNPQLLIGIQGNVESLRVRRYSADLSTVLFETKLDGFLAYNMMIDSAGATVLTGVTDSIIPLLHPTATCDLPSAPEKFWPQSPPSTFVLLRLDASGQLVQSTFLPFATTGISFSSVQPAGGGLLVWDDASHDWGAVTLGPLPDIQLACLGNAASLHLGPLAPEELVSLFGHGLGPDQPVLGQPDADNRYPLQLGGTEVTFDGVAAPVFYVSSGQINAVTPQALAGRTTTNICVVVKGAHTNCMDAPVQPAAPGIFPAVGNSPYTPYYAAAPNRNGLRTGSARSTRRVGCPLVATTST